MEDKMTEVDKLDLKSVDIAEDKRQELLRLFPEIRTEGGKVDFERLKLALGETVDTGKERYGMTWPGKADCFKTIQRPSLATLRPCPEESVNFDTTENLIIEGDNLEVLKLLQKSYLGKVKMIYIDPPYNTGNDFIYPDNYSESLQTYLEYTGQVDAEGRKFGTNTETDGRFHSKWLNMMYPRLYLARNLLREDGVIFISIDDGEVSNLRKLCDDVFGEDNFVGNMVWDGGRKNDSNKISIGHEYILVYCKNLTYESLTSDTTLWKERKEGIDEIYKIYEKAKKTHGSNWATVSQNLYDWYKSLPNDSPAKAHEHYKFADGEGVYFASDLSGPDDGRKNRPRYEVLHPITRKPVPVPSRGWRWEEPRMKEEIEKNRVHFGVDETSIPNGKVYLKENEWQAPSSVFYKDRRSASGLLRKLLEKKVFDFPKDPFVVQRLVKLVCRAQDISLDFFAGSGTTAHAVLDLNKQDGGHRKFIMVQLPEPCAEDSEAYKAGYKTIAEIGKERIRRVIKKLNGEEAGRLDLDNAPKQDRGFKVFKLSESNFNTWNADVSHDAPALEQQLEMHVNHIRDKRTEKDILYEILLKSGFPLATPVENIVIAGKTVYSAAGGALIICLERELTLELIRAIADKKPERVVFLDAGFAGNDQLKANAVQIFKTKSVTSFKTV